MNLRPDIARLLLSIAVLASASGCASRVIIDEVNTERIQKGQTTEADLITWFGPPAHRSTSAGGAVALGWDTKPSAGNEASAQRATLHVQLNPKGRVASYGVSAPTMQTLSVTGPDLYPVPTFDGYWGVVDGGVVKLAITVMNPTLEQAGDSTTTVTFFRRGAIFKTVEVPTPRIVGLGPGATLPLIEAPSECFGPDCSFEIHVNSKGEVAEPTQNTRNNRVADVLAG
jgi:hypothetical protein